MSSQRNLIILATLLCCLLPAAWAAEDTRNADLAHFRERALEALNAGDIAALTPLIAERAHLTFLDQTTVGGAAELDTHLAAIKKRYGIASWHFSPQVDRETFFPRPDIACAAGSCVETYTMEDGSENVFNTRWTATLVRTADGWRLSTLHVGSDPVDNPIVARLTESTGWAMFFSAVIAFAIAVGGTAVIARRRRS
jgi:ketosteroid isomerase-like protein